MVPRIIGRDLDLTGDFEVLEPETYIETPGKCGEQDRTSYSDWNVIGAEGLARGIIEVRGGSVRLQMYLHDVQRQKTVLGKEYNGDLSQLPAMSHRFANEIINFFTGEMGVFGTQIAFTRKVGRFKEGFVMDMDGSNVKQLTNDRALALSLNWHPGGKQLGLISYRTRRPELFLLNVLSGRFQQLTSNDNLEIGPRFSKDGNSIFVTRVSGDTGALIELGLNGDPISTISKINGVTDVSAALSPTGDQIAFCSNRAGSPQIYVMSNRAEPRRISFVSSSYCTSPAWSPKGDKIAFVCRVEGGSFQIFVSEPDGSNPVQLTGAGDNEDPDWAPNGRYMVFSTTAASRTPVIAIMKADGTNVRPISNGRMGDFDPSWGPVER
jgi:TolB protein